MLCPNCGFLFLPKLAQEPALALIRDARARPKATAAVTCPRCFWFIEGANRNTIAHEDCHKESA